MGLYSLKGGESSIRKKHDPPIEQLLLLFLERMINEHLLEFGFSRFNATGDIRRQDAVRRKETTFVQFVMRTKLAQ